MKKRELWGKNKKLKERHTIIINGSLLLKGVIMRNENEKPFFFSHLFMKRKERINLARMYEYVGGIERIE